MTLKRAKGRILALFAVMVALLTCATATPALAANTPATGATTTFDKYLVMDENASVPPVTFTFTISAGKAVDATDGSALPIYAGNDTSRVTGSPSIDSASFSTTDKTHSSVQGDDGLSLSSGQKYAKKSVTVNFRDVKYSAMGIYRYIITENSSSASGITNDAESTRTLDVYVQYGEGDNLIVADYVLYKSSASSDKSDGFTNTYATNDLTLEKNVTGNQGDRDKYFAFTVNISDAVAGTIYTVDLTDADESPMVDGTGETNPASLTVAAGGTVKATFYLKHEQSIVIQGLTSGTKYTITETDYSADGYTTTNTDNTADGADGKTTGQHAMGTVDHTVTFTNDKDGAIPTGILLETTPYLVMGGVVVVGLVALVATRRRRAR